MKDKNWLDYYENHYLLSVANLFSRNPKIDASFKEEIFRASKNIKNQRERKKILKTIYHNFDSENPFFEESNRILLILKKDNFTSKALSFYLNQNNFKNYDSAIESIDEFNKFGEDSVKITHPDFDLDGYLKYSKKLSKRLNYPNFFDEVKDCVSGFTLEPVENIKDAFELSQKYKNCWQSTMGDLIKRHDFFLINIRNTDNVLIGTLRYLTLNNKDEDDKKCLSGWVNSEIVDDEKFFEFSVSLLKEISQKIYNHSHVENYNPDNMRIELHYNNPNKTISSLLPWNREIENDISSFLGNKLDSKKLENNSTHIYKNKRNRFS